jgi:hypothetical protein
LLVNPPRPIQRWARRLKTVTGPIGRLLERIIWKVVLLSSAPGYKNDVGTKLREEIRSYFAEDNRRLEELIRGTFGRASNRENSPDTSSASTSPDSSATTSGKCSTGAESRP